MFVTKAQMFTPEQINTVITVGGALVLTNIGQLFSWAYRKVRKEIKDENDIKAAHDKIRKLTLRVDQLEGEKK
jgi:hypothetical protein